jgi:hypothetical protein
MRLLRRAERALSTCWYGERHPPLFIGHSNDGEVVVAATHLDAMNGLAVSASDIGVTGGSEPNDEPSAGRGSASVPVTA